MFAKNKLGFIEPEIQGEFISEQTRVQNVDQITSTQKVSFICAHFFSIHLFVQVRVFFFNHMSS